MIPVDRSHLFVAADSHPGMSGKNNEDRYAVSAFRFSEENPLPVLFAVLADGIGGHKAGEVAAETAVEVISQGVAGSDATHPLSTLTEAIIQASQTILGLSEADQQQKGMGSTCACSWVIGGKENRNQLYVAYVGDSRIYLIRDNTIQQLSNDHTWIQEAIQAGVLTPEQARGHPNAHVIRRHLGSLQPVEPDTRLRLHPDETDEQMRANQGMYLQPDDLVVLCSDGLTDLVGDQEILAAFTEKKPKAAIAGLIQLANSRGGHDNITIVALQVPGQYGKPLKASQTKPLPPSMKRRTSGLNWKLACLGAAVTALILGILILAGVYLLLPTLSGSATETPVPSLTLSVPENTATTAPDMLSLPTETPALHTTATVPNTVSETVAPVTPSPSGPTYTPWPTNTPAGAFSD